MLIQTFVVPFLIAFNEGPCYVNGPLVSFTGLDHSLNISAIPGTCAPVPISHPKGSALAAIQEDIRENNILAEDTVLGRRISNESIKQRRPNLRCSETAANTQDLKAGFPTDNMNGKPETADKKPDQPIPGFVWCFMVFSPRNAKNYVVLGKIWLLRPKM